MKPFPTGGLFGEHAHRGFRSLLYYPCCLYFSMTNRLETRRPYGPERNHHDGL